MVQPRMKTYNPSKPLISVHIPKCAGTSFTQVLRDWFGPGFHGHYANEKQNQLPKKHKLTRGLFGRKPIPNLCVHGHFNNQRGTGVRDYYPKADQLISILRDPFELHLSNFFFVKRQARFQGGGAFRSGKAHPIIANDWNLADFLENSKYSYVLNFLPPEINEDNYERVLRQNFLYIGLTEELQKSVDELARVLGFPTAEVPHKNTSEWSEDIPAGAREQFRTDNPLVFAIYDFVKRNWGNNQSG